MLIKVYRTTRYKIKESALEQACLALCLASKNLKNTGMFLIRNVLSSLDTQTNTLKTILNENQKEVINFFNLSVGLVNKRRIEKNILRAQEKIALEAKFTNKTIDQREFDEQVEKLKPRKIFKEINSCSTPSDFWAVLDDSILDQLTRFRKDNKDTFPFKALLV